MNDRFWSLNILGNIFIVAVVDRDGWTRIDEFPTLERAKELAIPMSAYKNITVQIEEMSADKNILYRVLGYRNREMISETFFDGKNNVVKMYEIDGNSRKLVYPVQKELAKSDVPVVV
jgi:hypothetical protein